MTSPEPIECRPTSWFRYRAGLIILMFTAFAVLFYIDGSTNYRKKNQAFYLHQSFEKASNVFSEQNAEQSLTPEDWKDYASRQMVDMPSDRSILPRNLDLPMPWPDVLGDFDRMKSLQWNQLWLDYTAELGWDAKPPEKPYDARAIREQWIFFYICSTMAIIGLFFLIRTSRRRITATEDALIAQDGRRIAYADFKRLDLRKWDTKGIAIADYEGASGSGRVRIDGLTYGGFKKVSGCSAEKLMQQLRDHFSGEIIEYASVDQAVDVQLSQKGEKNQARPESGS